MLVDPPIHDNATAILGELKATPGVRLVLENERYVAFELGEVTHLVKAQGQPIGEFLRDEPITPALQACNGAARVGFEPIGTNVVPVPPGPVEVPVARDFAVWGGP